MEEHAHVIKCDICDRFYVEFFVIGETGNNICHICDLCPDPIDRYNSEALLNKVLETGNIFCLTDSEEFELHYSHVFDYHPMLKRDSLLLDLSLYLWEKFEA